MPVGTLTTQSGMVRSASSTPRRAEDEEVERHHAQRQEDDREAGDAQAEARVAGGPRRDRPRRGSRESVVAASRVPMADRRAGARGRAPPSHSAERAQRREDGERGAGHALGEHQPIGDRLLRVRVVARERAGEDELPEAAEVDAQRAGDAVRLVGVDERVVERIPGQRRLVEPDQEVVAQACRGAARRRRARRAAPWAAARGTSACAARRRGRTPPPRRRARARRGGSGPAARGA